MRLTANVRDRGKTPRGLKRAHGNAAKEAWYLTALQFHRYYRAKRFTEAHARAAGYARRKGELMPRGTKAFDRSYTGRKLKMKGHTLPLVWSGETRDAVKFANITSTRTMGRAAYAGAKKLNYRHPKSKIRMNEEFKLIIPSEATELGEYFDTEYDRILSAITATS